jgi:hypothetical protein
MWKSKNFDALLKNKGCATDLYAYAVPNREINANLIFINSKGFFHLSLIDKVTVRDIKDILGEKSVNMPGWLVNLKTHEYCIFKWQDTKDSVEDLFWRKYSFSKAKTTFKKDLIRLLHDCYIEHDNPDTDPTHGRREEIWHELLPEYRIYNQRAIHIDELPEPACTFISLDTVKRTIKELKC